MAVVVWDATGVALFLVWLVLPPAYTVVLGRKYVRQARAAVDEAQNAAQDATWASEDAQDVLDSCERMHGPQEEAPPRLPKHRLDESRLAQGVAS